MEREDHVKIVEALKLDIGDENVINWKIPRARRIFVTVKADKLIDAVKHLAENGFGHVTTISGVDVGDGIEVVYHLTRRGRESITLSLKVKTDMKNSSLPTISGIIPGASIYEREVHDLLGVNFKEHPNLAPLVIPDNWPEGIRPLLKKWKVEEIRKRLAENEGD
ncbi:hypothetical protein DRO56_00095 [Candidatus Bathyarchaeota archaeon]|nr:MAG: hypothetical protein DRO56_00095 [Candidatus Bathyarchaeota archaeon]